MSMPLDQCHAMCFPNMEKYLDDLKSESFEIADMPYKLKFKNSVMSLYDDCNYCGNRQCRGCPVGTK